MSGAEWWSQTIEAGDDIGFHWDRDYGLEEDHGEHAYPYYGTVTYLNDKGAPTIVLLKEGTTNSEKPIIGTIDEMVISLPHIGNHIYFRGDLLHAATTEILTPEEDNKSQDEDEESSSGANIENGIEDLQNKRITFLVNLWINHIPSQAEKCPATMIEKLSSKHVKAAHEYNFSRQQGVYDCLTIPVKVKDCLREELCNFNNSGVNYDVHIPLPPVDTLNERIRGGGVALMRLVYEESQKIDIEKSAEQPEGSEEEEDDDDEDDDQVEEDAETIDESESQEDCEEVISPAKRSRT